MSERQITDQDRDLLNEAISSEYQAQWIAGQIRRCRRDLDILERLKGAVEALHKIQKDEIKKRELGEAYRTNLRVAGLEKGL